ncbi:MAG: TatD family hydrolase [Spirochaetia bacterium]|jgi:TatD DNase family protein|nr:TatD family hydrolase [Spirochaetia bacterium]
MADKLPILPGMIDSHFHYLEMLKKELDPQALLSECFSAGMSAAVDIATNTANFDKRLDFALGFDNIFITAGLNPGKADRETSEVDEMLKTLELQITGAKEHGRLIALGETGLDWYWNYGTREKQISLFETQVGMAEKYSLPVIIHNRDADEDVLNILKAKKPSSGGIIHCFSSDYNFAASCIDLGFMISFAGNVTYKKNTSLHEAARRIPSSSILAETDAPYLSPRKLRSFPGHPGFVSHTYEFLAETRGEKIGYLTDTVKSNFNRLFRKNL